MKIYVQPDGPNFLLWCADGKMADAPAGPRLFRAPPIPDVRFSHPDPFLAERDASLLRLYLDQCKDDKGSR